MSHLRTPCNILVTGGAGFIGSAFIRYLLTDNTNFKGVCVNYDALTYAGNLENLATCEDDSRYRFIHGDIKNQKLIEHSCDEHEIDTIIHFAAESHVDRSIENPQTFIETNVLGTFHFLEAVKKRPHIHFHHVSTDEVYGCLGSTGLFSEKTPYSPNSPYSASKAASDHLVRSYAKTYGISTCISNCSNNYGPYQFPEKLIPLMILKCLTKEELPVYGNGANIRDWLFVDDHVEALWTLLCKGKPGETYNIGGDAELSNLDVVYKLIDAIAISTETDKRIYLNLIKFVSDRPGHDFRYAIDFSKIQQELNWSPRHTFDQGLLKTVDWYTKNQEWVDHVCAGTYTQWLETNYTLR